ncbi:cysteine rich repeat-containing protein [Limnohabitans sp. Bal53]|uniref:cysteine rich repeat-containing protein n=1 Tax=Limnohabitans sp. Bal53 TaxID=1977910 RepID=UPI0011B1F7FF|nr:cysteine rich repeat-containing protein [Limnohabitans sp. Bal53]
MNRLARPPGLFVTSLILLTALTLTTNVHAQIPTKEQRAAMQACREDASKHCAGVMPGGGRMAICLREKKASLTPGCSTQIEKLEVCGADTKRACNESGK